MATAVRRNAPLPSFVEEPARFPAAPSKRTPRSSAKRYPSALRKILPADPSGLLQPMPARRPNVAQPDAPAHASQDADQTPAPFLKWVGGKGRILSQLLPLLPSGAHAMRHIEPFLGGGAMFFARLPTRALLCDINEDLVHTYVQLQQRPEALINALLQLENAHCTDQYYLVREAFNQLAGDAPSALPPSEATLRAAQFIYLNKTCFNGLFRVNRAGKFNVPAGRYLRPNIVNPNKMLATSRALQSATLQTAGYEALLSSAKPGDFIYLDPPYEPVSATANFTSYAEGGFSFAAQQHLAEVFRALDQRGIKLMLSNSDVPRIRGLYEGFRIDTVAAPRAVSCKAESRKRITEVVVRNYAD